MIYTAQDQVWTLKRGSFWLDSPPRSEGFYKFSIKLIRIQNFSIYLRVLDVLNPILTFFLAIQIFRPNSFLSGWSSSTPIRFEARL
jgi:hypothetical protein